MEKVLVTGSEGFIGSHLVEQLVTRGYQVRALVQYNSFSNWGWLEQLNDDIKDCIEVVMGDVRDPNAMYKIVESCKSVIHLAALIAIPYSYNSPDSYVETNVKGTLNILQASRSKDVSKFIQTSTSEVYGSAKYVPINESHPLSGQSPYAASKIGADQLALSFYSSFGLPVSIARPFNTYGPRQSNRAIIPTIISQILSGLTNIRLGSLEPTRDFSFVSDTVDAFIALLESNQFSGNVFNFGSGFEISIGETVNVIAEVFGKSINVIGDSERVRPKDSEVHRLFADTSKAIELLDWSPGYAGREGFKRGISQTIDWFRDPRNLDLYKPSFYNT